MNKVKDFSNQKPIGELVLQTVAMPRDANAYGDMFGGWMLAQMDVGGAVLANRLAQNRVTTVSIERMSFIKPVYVGDLVSCYASKIKTGRSSITIKVDVWVTRMRFAETLHVTEGIFTYVALDAEGRPKPVFESPA